MAFEVSLPELFTVTSQEYEAMHSAWCKAIKVLPHFSVVHKQDWFVSESYAQSAQFYIAGIVDYTLELLHRLHELDNHLVIKLLRGYSPTAEAGLVCQRELQAGIAKGRFEFP